MTREGEGLGGRVFSRGFTLLLTGMVAAAAAAEAAAAAVGRGVPGGVDVALSVGVALALALRFRAGVPPSPLLAAAALPVEAALLAPGRAGAALVWVLAAARALLASTSLAAVPTHSRKLALGADVTLAQLAIAAAVVILLGAAGVYVAERGRGGIESFSDALWWALATATTVGYGDVVPTTPAGRAIAAVLMIFGIGFLGVFLSDMAARIARAMAEEEDDLPVLEREKRVIARAVLRLEDLSQDEVEVLVNKIKVLYVLLTAGRPEERAAAARGMAVGARVTLGAPQRRA